MPAPLKNQYAAKPAADRKDSVIYVRMTAREKSACVRAARGQGLSEWAAAKILAAAKN